MNCLYCKLGIGAHFRFLRGAVCIRCGERTDFQPMAEYVRDEVTKPGKFLHVFRCVSPRVIVCKGCGFSKNTLRFPCHDANSTAEAKEKEPAFQTA